MTLPAGDKLDVLVAEKVMGWRKPDPDARDPKYPLSPRDSQGRWYNGEEELDEFHATPEGDGGGDYYQPDESWSPSTDIRAAMEIADKLGDMTLRKTAKRNTSGGVDWGCFFELLRNRLRDEEPLASIEARRRLGMQFGTPYLYADTAPLAICRAALAAVGAL